MSSADLTFQQSQILTSATILYPDYIRNESIPPVENFSLVLCRILKPDLSRGYVARVAYNDSEAGTKLVLQSGGCFEEYPRAVEDLMRMMCERVAGTRGVLVFPGGPPEVQGRGS